MICSNTSHTKTHNTESAFQVPPKTIIKHIQVHQTHSTAGLICSVCVRTWKHQAILGASNVMDISSLSMQLSNSYCKWMEWNEWSLFWYKTRAKNICTGVFWGKSMIAASKSYKEYFKNLKSIFFSLLLGHLLSEVFSTCSCIFQNLEFKSFI